jgi:hypothetical protein
MLGESANGLNLTVLDPLTNRKGLLEMIPMAFFFHRNTTGVSLWMKIPAAIYASGQAKLAL